MHSTAPLVQIMNGHKYEINDTITTRTTAFGQSVFKVRTVNILPLDDEAAEATTGEAEAPSKPTTTEAATTNSKTTEADAMEPGSPEVLDANHSDNEIGHAPTRYEVQRI